MELKKQTNRNQERDGYETDKRPRTEKTWTEGNKANWKLEKNETEKAVMQSGYTWNQFEEVPDVYGG